MNDGCFPSLAEVPRTALSLTVPLLMRVPRAVAIVPGPAKRAAIEAAAPGPGHDRLPRVDPAPPPRRDALPGRGLRRRARLSRPRKETPCSPRRRRRHPVRARAPGASRSGRGATAAEPSLVELLTSAGEYVLAYEDAFRVVVAEEVYVQRLRASPGGPVQQTRRLSSDVAFVRAPGTALPWWLLRDVYEVDGGVVRDRQARLEKLLVESPAVGLERARAIADEGARFNLGRSVRNFNVPTLVLAFLHPSLQPRFSFERKGTTTIEGRSFVEIAFRELAAPIGHPRPRCAPGRARRGPGLDPRREGRHGGSNRARPGPGRGRDQDPRDPRHGVPAVPGARPVGPGRDARPPPDRARRRSAAGPAASSSSRAWPPTAASARPGSARRRSSASRSLPGLGRPADHPGSDRRHGGLAATD